MDEWELQAPKVVDFTKLSPEQGQHDDWFEQAHSHHHSLTPRTMENKSNGQLVATERGRPTLKKVSPVSPGLVDKFRNMRSGGEGQPRRRRKKRARSITERSMFQSPVYTPQEGNQPVTSEAQKTPETTHTEGLVEQRLPFMSPLGPGVRRRTKRRCFRSTCISQRKGSSEQPQRRMMGISRNVLQSGQKEVDSSPWRRQWAGEAQSAKPLVLSKNTTHNRVQTNRVSSVLVAKNSKPSATLFPKSHMQKMAPKVTVHSNENLPPSNAPAPVR